MVRTLTLALAMCTAVATLTAQTPAPAGQPAVPQPAAQQPAAPQPAPQQPAPATAANKVTYSGCLKPGTAAGSWALENAEIPSMASAQAKPGDSPVGTSGAAMKAFNLSTKEDLKAHANHKIEVTGTVSQPSASAPAAGAASTSAPRPTLNVDSFKMVAATCP